MAITFPTSMTAYAQGRRVNMEEWNTITRELEGATALKFGAPVERGTLAHQCDPYSSGEFIGVSEASLVLPRPGDQYERYDSVAICESGVIGVLAGENVTHGQLAGYSGAANGGAGGWMVADTANPAIPGCQFETSGSAGQVVALRVRRPVPTA